MGSVVGNPSLASGWKMPGDICIGVTGYLCHARCLSAYTQGQAQQVGGQEKQNWQGLAEIIRFLCPTQGKSHLLCAGLS